MRISCIDLFCGAGGLTHGLIKGGIRVTAGIDVDPACSFAYEANNDGAKYILKDISDVRPSELIAQFVPNSISVLAGCAPCQPFSTYSHRYDLRRDGKWTLLNEFGRLVKGVRPDIVTMENVPAITKAPIFQDFLLLLKRQQYQVWYGVVDCSNYGVPQTRKRTVLLASKLGPISFIAPICKKPRTVKSAIGRLSPINAGERSKRDRLHVAASLSPRNLKRIKASRPGGTWRDWSRRLVADCHRGATGRTFPSVYGRMEWDKPAPTMTTQCYGFGNGRFGHPEQDRAISLREAAIFQGFPRTYKFVPPGAPVEFKPLGRLIGNAVPVDLGYAIALSIKRHVKQVNRKSKRRAKAA